jgi:hypothetical protein
MTTMGMVPGGRLTVNTLDHVEALSAMRDGRRAQFGRE